MDNPLVRHPISTILFQAYHLDPLYSYILLCLDIMLWRTHLQLCRYIAINRRNALHSNTNVVWILSMMFQIQITCQRIYHFSWLHKYDNMNHHLVGMPNTKSLTTTNFYFYKILNNQHIETRSFMPQHQTNIVKNCLQKVALRHNIHKTLCPSLLGFECGHQEITYLS